MDVGHSAEEETEGQSGEERRPGSGGWWQWLKPQAGGSEWCSLPCPCHTLVLVHLRAEGKGMCQETHRVPLTRPEPPQRRASFNLPHSTVRQGCCCCQRGTGALGGGSLPRTMQLLDPGPSPAHSVKGEAVSCLLVPGATQLLGKRWTCGNSSPGVGRARGQASHTATLKGAHS